jgi:hypothetical protein
MMTVQAIPAIPTLSDPRPLLLGSLKLNVVGMMKRPVLACVCHCPFCRDSHSVD